MLGTDGSGQSVCLNRCAQTLLQCSFGGLSHCNGTSEVKTRGRILWKEKLLLVVLFWVLSPIVLSLTWICDILGPGVLSWLGRLGWFSKEVSAGCKLTEGSMRGFPFPSLLWRDVLWETLLYSSAWTKKTFKIALSALDTAWLQSGATEVCKGCCLYLREQGFVLHCGRCNFKFIPGEKGFEHLQKQNIRIVEVQQWDCILFP